MLIGLIREDTPNIKRILIMLLPKIFPNRILLYPFLAELNETINSGRDVPTAITVRPIMFGGI